MLLIALDCRRHISNTIERRLFIFGTHTVYLWQLFVVLFLKSTTNDEIITQLRLDESLPVETVRATRGIQVSLTL